MKTQQSITVNEKEIQIVTKGTEKYVAIRPICEAIGVDFKSQLDKIKDDEILSSVVVLSTMTGADEKGYKMQTIPLRFAFGWLFTINPKNVKPEIKKEILEFRMQCYNSLYDTFTKRNTILIEKTNYQQEIEVIEEDLKKDERYKKIQELKSAMKNASQRLNSMDKGVINEQLDFFKQSSEENER